MERLIFVVHGFGHLTPLSPPTSHFRRDWPCQTIRTLMFFLLIAGYTCPGTTQETETVVKEFNRTQFLPLEVGNRWTFVHTYRNELYPIWEGVYSEDWPEEEAAYWESYFKRFEIPGYPLGSQPPPLSHPPNSLTHAKVAEISVEITHTEWIGGFEYFVFSGPSYSWPPLPPLFWAEKKVRFSEDGILFLHIDDSDVPLYDFRVPSLEVRWYGYGIDPLLTGKFDPKGASRWMDDQLTYPFFPAHLEISINQAYRDNVLEVGFWLYTDPELPAVLDEYWEVLFLRGVVSKWIWFGIL